MLREMVLRFLVGGLVVSAFAALGELFKSKTFAGVFGAAPSVALASLGLTYPKRGVQYVASEALPMLIGAIAFCVYATVCVAMIRRELVPVWASTVVAWTTWFAVAVGLFFLARTSGALQ